MRWWVGALKTARGFTCGVFDLSVAEEGEACREGRSLESWGFGPVRGNVAYFYTFGKSFSSAGPEILMTPCTGLSVCFTPGPHSSPVQFYKHLKLFPVKAMKILENLPLLYNRDKKVIHGHEEPDKPNLQMTHSWAKKILSNRFRVTSSWGFVWLYLAPGFKSLFLALYFG